MVAINKNELLELFDQLPETAKQSAFDFMKYLSTRNVGLAWDEIAQLKPDEAPLDGEEQRQLNDDGGFMSWEEAMHELSLSPDTKS